jgi:hypothetical protein
LASPARHRATFDRPKSSYLAPTSAALAPPKGHAGHGHTGDSSDSDSSAFSSKEGVISVRPSKSLMIYVLIYTLDVINLPSCLDPAWKSHISLNLGGSLLYTSWQFGASVGERIPSLQTLRSRGPTGKWRPRFHISNLPSQHGSWDLDYACITSFVVLKPIHALNLRPGLYLVELHSCSAAFLRHL